MKHLVSVIFGSGEHLEILQMCARTAFVFFITILLVRISGRRSFGMKSPFDNVIVILLGAVLSRGVVGASPFMATMCACLVLVALHRLVAWATLHHPFIGRGLKGKSIPLYEDGKLNGGNMDKSLISTEDLMEELRLRTNKATLSDVESASLERNGEIGIVLKAK